LRFVQRWTTKEYRPGRSPAVHNVWRWHQMVDLLLLTSAGCSILGASIAGRLGAFLGAFVGIACAVLLSIVGAAPPHNGTLGRKP
jgi:hypothetical protein